MSTPPALVLVAHGSSDPRAAATCQEIGSALAALAPDLDVHLAYLERVQPDPLTVLRGLEPRPVVLVPLLLSAAFHVDVDIQAVARGARQRVRVAAALMPHPLLLEVAADRLTEAGVGNATTVVLASTGTSSPSANDVTAQFAETLAARRGRPVVNATATAKPTVREALSALADTDIAVLTWLLSPGHFADVIADEARRAGAAYTAPLGAHPALVQALLERYMAAANAS